MLFKSKYSFYLGTKWLRILSIRNICIKYSSFNRSVLISEIGSVGFMLNQSITANELKTPSSPPPSTSSPVNFQLIHFVDFLLFVVIVYVAHSIDVQTLVSLCVCRVPSLRLTRCDSIAWCAAQQVKRIQLNAFN